MSISIPIPLSYKLPLFQAAVDGSQAGNLTETQPALLVGQAFLGGEASSAPKSGGNTGNGVLTLDPVTPVVDVGAMITAEIGFVPAIYKVKFTSPTAYAVTDPLGAAVGTGTVGTTFSNFVKFIVTAGSTAFVANDEFDITVINTPVGTGALNIPVPVGSIAMAQQLYGTGSMLARMFEKFFANNTTQQIWCIAIPRPSAGIKATGSIQITVRSYQSAYQNGVFSGPTYYSSDSGILYTYIADQVVQVVVNEGDSGATIAFNLVIAINQNKTLPVYAAVDGTDATKVDLTCRWHGLTGNDIQISFNYLGAYGGQTLPGGVITNVTPMSGGAGNPDFSAAIAAIAPRQFYHVAMPYTDSASQQVWDADYGFGPGGRWDYTRQQYGWIYNYLRFDYSDALVWGQMHNSAVISTMVLEPAAPTPVWEWTAAYCGQASAALLDDPAAPLQSLELQNCLPAPLAVRFSNSELNNLTNAGLAIQGVAPSGNAVILREALQYQFNVYGQADDAYGLITVLSNLAELLSRMKSAITTKYPRHKLAPDGTRFGPGQKVLTPKIATGEIVSELRKAEYDGLTANVDQAIKTILVQINDNNPNRLDVLYPPQLMGQLRQFDVLAQFRLQYDTTSAA